MRVGWSGVSGSPGGSLGVVEVDGTVGVGLLVGAGDVLVAGGAGGVDRSSTGRGDG